MKTADGFVLIDGRMVRGHAVSEGGVTELFEGPCRGKADLYGVILPSLNDTHTHCADAGAKPEPGMTLEELVAPPNGLKHRYLRETPRDVLVKDMHAFGEQAKANGIGTFVDFREGGAEGCRMAREACASAVILGRPSASESGPSELEEILSVADGIALSSLTDVGYAEAEKAAHAAHSAGKPFAIHCSERIREDIDSVLSLEPAFLVHMCEASDSDLRKCADAGIPISVCARSNRFFGKVPPLKRMKDIGCTVSMGTDNAMLCTPDLRPEAALFREILGSAEYDGWIWECMTAGATELLYRTRGIHACKREEEYIVLPLSGTGPESAWSSADRVPSL